MTRTHTLVSFELCPFVQRSSITLQHKGVDHDIRYIDLYDKPAWFVAISPFGKVPLLLVKEGGEQTVLFESAVINEYLDEVTTEQGHPRLHPEDTLTRAVHRAWIELASALVGAQHMLSMAKDEGALTSHHANVRDILQRLEDALGEGPWFAGSELSLVDTAMAPPLQRLLWLADIWPEQALFEGLPKVRAWAERLVALPAVQASTVPDIRARFDAYVAGRGSPSRKVEPSLFGERVAAG